MIINNVYTLTVRDRLCAESDVLVLKYGLGLENIGNPRTLGFGH